MPGDYGALGALTGIVPLGEAIRGPGIIHQYVPAHQDNAPHKQNIPQHTVGMAGKNPYKPAARQG